MKRKLKKLLLLILIGIFTFSSTNIVSAISSRGDLPISYEIVGFNVFIFNDQGMTQTQSKVTNESIKHFPVRELQYTTTDEIKMEHGYTLVSTQLNVDGGVQSLEKIAENIVSENKSNLNGGKDGKYLITFSVKYKLTLPDNTSVYDSDYANVFSGDQKLLKEENKANETVGLDQMLIAGVYDSTTNTVDWNNQAQYHYDVSANMTHIFTSRSHLMPNYDQYLIFTNDKKPGDVNIEDVYHHVMSENYGESYRYMMYINNTSTSTEGDKPNDNQPSTDEPSTEPTPNVPNTDDNKPSDTTPIEPDKNEDDDQDDNKQENPTTPVKPNDNNNNNNNDSNNNNNNSGSNTTVTEKDSKNNTSTSQTLSVPNTANNSNSNLTLSGILLLASGCGIIKLTKKEEEENSI